MEDLEYDKFVGYLREIFRAPDDGTKQIMITDGKWWRWIVGEPDSFQVSDDTENWRIPMPDEIEQLRKKFGFVKG